MASNTELALINQAITEGRLKNSAGNVITKTVDDLLIRSDRQVAYLVRNRIPIMLKDEGVEIKGIIG